MDTSELNGGEHTTSLPDGVTISPFASTDSYVDFQQFMRIEKNVNGVRAKKQNGGSEGEVAPQEQSPAQDADQSKEGDDEYDDDGDDADDPSVPSPSPTSILDRVDSRLKFLRHKLHDKFGGEQ